MSRAWVHQDDKQVKKHGPEKASYYCSWIDPAGKRKCKSCGPGVEGKRQAERLREKVQAQLNTGTYDDRGQRTWEEFRREYEEQILPRLAVRTRLLTVEALDAFQRVIKPMKMLGVDAKALDRFTSTRSREPGRKAGSTLSPQTLNKQLRHLRAVLNVAHEWGYLKDSLKVRMVRTPVKLVRYVTPEDFAAIYEACDTARLPADLPFPAVDWWRGLLTFAMLTGWRISEMLALKWEDVNLDKAVALTRHTDNKGSRDELVPLHPVIVEHLERIRGFGTLVFPWNYDRRTLDSELDRIQTAAGIHLPCRGEHQHTPACHLYSFHDWRRGFATSNAEALGPEALQRLMRHKSYQTTKVYIALAANTLTEAVKKLAVPELRTRRNA